MAASLLSSTDRALQAMAMTSSGGALTVSGAAAERSGGRMLLQGATGFGMGVIHGAVGLVHEPYMGARRRGARGFAVGVGKGLAGAVIRPTAGVLQLTNNMAGAWVAMTHGLTGGEGGEGGASGTRGPGRVRPPRMLHDQLQRIAPFSMAEALGRHVLTTAEEGQYLQEPLLYCDLLGEAGTTSAVIAVLTGIRLLTVDSSTWRVQLNLPLRKLDAIAYGPPSPQHVLLLLLEPKRAAAAAAAAGAAAAATSASGEAPTSSTTKLPNMGSAELRSLACHSEEAAATLHDHLVDALASLRARRRIWHSARSGSGVSQREHHPISAAL